MAQKVQAAVEVVSDLVDEVLDFIEPIQDLIDPVQDRLYNAVKDTAFIQAIQRDARERPFSHDILVSSPLGRFVWIF